MRSARRGAIVAAGVATALLLAGCSTERKATTTDDGAGPTRVERVRMIGGDWGFPLSLIHI